MQGSLVLSAIALKCRTIRPVSVYYNRELPEAGIDSGGFGGFSGGNRFGGAVAAGAGDDEPLSRRPI
jgi:hypothetical protein